MEEWNSIKDNVVRLWDSGEMLVGFGEFLENKNLVPSPYNKDRGRLTFQKISINRKK